MADLPTVIGPAGLQPQTPAQLRAAIVALVQQVVPGFTDNLPASLIEDIVSTDVYALALIDAARVEMVNSLTPFGANVFLLNQLGAMLGIQQGQATNTSVFVQFTGPAGYVIPQGFTLSDGTHQYTVQDGGVINTGGVSELLFCLATQPGSWAIPTSTVTQIVTSYPSSIVLGVTNPEAGLPGIGTETEASYRARVLQANTAESQGMVAYLKTLLTQVSGVQPRLVSVLQQTGGGWEVICGGGDPYEVAYAIYKSLFDISLLTGSFLLVENITNASNGVITTNLYSNYTVGQVINIVGVVGMTGINNTPLTVASIISPTQFSITLDTTAAGAYVSGGIITPNLRNITKSLNDYPNTYNIPFVNPPQESVNITATWNTNFLDFVASAGVAQLANPAIVSYINSIPAGQAINIYELQTVFSAAVAPVLAPDLLTKLTFSVSINSVTTPPNPGTGIIVGDPESYFQTQTTQVVVVQG